MTAAFLVTFINYFVTAFNILILIRVILTWVPSVAENAFGRFIFDATEPILAPIRKVLPQGYGLDFSPLVAYILLQLMAQFASKLLTG